MVYFTCNHCGGSVKKPGVVKHYATKCRNVPIALTCMDCQKDFHEKAYNEHTQCISEVEKYSGKDYVPKPGQNKGQRKQDSWMDTIRSLSTDQKHKMDPKIRNVFGRLVSFDNIPRKKAKFENFVSNSFKIPKPIAMKVWEVLEIALAELKNVKKTDQNGQDANKENGPDENEENSEKTGFEKKNKKISETEEVDDNGESENSKKNKKKSKRKVENIENTNEELDVVDSEPSKKKKKKDKVKNLIVEETENHEKQVIENGIEKKKSKKNKHENTNGHTTDNNDKENEIHNALLNKKKKKDQEANHTEENDVNQKLDWISIINECASDGMNVGKLKKKVVKKFLKTNPDIPGDKLDKKFQKHLKKTGLVIDNDIIKISS